MVPTLSIQPGQGSGLYTFTGFANVQYTSIENGGATTPYHINLDATATGIENIRLQRSNEAAIGANFEVYNSDTNALLYGGLFGNVLSFTFLGSANANTVTIDDANGWSICRRGTLPQASATTETSRAPRKSSSAATAAWTRLCLRTRRTPPIKSTASAQAPRRARKRAKSAPRTARAC